MRKFVSFTLVGFALGTSPSIVRGDGYPEATLDQATHETICDLGIERYQGLDEEGMQAEYQWALDMAKLCLPGPDSIQERRSWRSPRPTSR